MKSIEVYLEEKWFAQKTFVVFALQDSIAELLWWCLLSPTGTSRELYRWEQIILTYSIGKAFSSCL